MRIRERKIVAFRRMIEMMNEEPEEREITEEE
jgi:hypothetical protein